MAGFIVWLQQRGLLWPIVATGVVLLVVMAGVGWVTFKRRANARRNTLTIGLAGPQDADAVRGFIATARPSGSADTDRATSLFPPNTIIMVARRQKEIVAVMGLVVAATEKDVRRALSGLSLDRLRTAAAQPLPLPLLIVRQLVTAKGHRGVFLPMRRAVVEMAQATNASAVAGLHVTSTVIEILQRLGADVFDVEGPEIVPWATPRKAVVIEASRYGDHLRRLVRAARSAAPAMRVQMPAAMALYADWHHNGCQSWFKD